MSTVIHFAREKIHREMVENPDGTTTGLTYFEPTEEKMRALVEILFQEHWSEITVGPCIEGAVFEIRFQEPSKISLLDGYLTVDLRHWHFHLCIGEHRGTRSELVKKYAALGISCSGGARAWRLETGGLRLEESSLQAPLRRNTTSLRSRRFFHKLSEELARKRQVARIAFMETRGGGCGSGRSWGLRLWNGFGEQMTTVFLPSPFLSDELKVLKEPQWERLRLWYELRRTFLGEAMPSDCRTAQEGKPGERV